VTLGDLLAFVIQSPQPIFTALGEMADANKIMSFVTAFLERSGSHPDRIRINPEIRIRISDHIFVEVSRLCVGFRSVSTVEFYSAFKAGLDLPHSPVLQTPEISKH